MDKKNEIKFDYSLDWLNWWIHNDYISCLGCSCTISDFCRRKNHWVNCWKTSWTISRYATRIPFSQPSQSSPSSLNDRKFPSSTALCAISVVVEAISRRKLFFPSSDACRRFGLYRPIPPTRVHFRQRSQRGSSGTVAKSCPEGEAVGRVGFGLVLVVVGWHEFWRAHQSGCFVACSEICTGRRFHHSGNLFSDHFHHCWGFRNVVAWLIEGISSWLIIGLIIGLIVRLIDWLIFDCKIKWLVDWLRKHFSSWLNCQ